MDFVFDNSECSNGCESGWTLYLDTSCISPYGTYKGNDIVEEKRVKEEEEDLSMVSDASSGPPHFHEDDYYGHNNNGCTSHEPIHASLPKKNGKREKSRETRRCKIQEQPSLLDDTASSSIFDFSNASVPNIDFSQGYSTTHIEGRSAYQDHYGFLQSSLSGNQLQQNQWYEGKRW